MKDNIKIYLATKLQDISKKVRQNEEEYMNRYKEFCSNDDTTNRNAYNSGDRFDNNNKSQPNSFLEYDKNNDILKQRDAEINNLVKSIGELAQVFQDLSVLVHEQGTILDRIDVNIEASLENTKQANKHLIQTEKNIESSCARNSIIILIIIIFVQALLLLLKFANK